jgi:hypothetical protein
MSGTISRREFVRGGAILAATAGVGLVGLPALLDAAGRGAQTESERFLAAYWGFNSEDYRAPLPVTTRFDMVRRNALWMREQWGIAHLDHPPYITGGTFQYVPGVVAVNIYAGNGVRAGMELTAPDGEEDGVYADGQNLPPEWVAPVSAAVAEMRACWPAARFAISREELDAVYEAERRDERLARWRARGEAKSHA